MRRSQWFVLSIVFLLTGILSAYQANHQSDKWEEFSDKELESLEEVKGEKIWSEQLVVSLLRQQSSTHSYWDSYLLLSEFSSLYLVISIACWICGFIEPEAEKKKK